METECHDCGRSILPSEDFGGLCEECRDWEEFTAGQPKAEWFHEYDSRVDPEWWVGSRRAVPEDYCEHGRLVCDGPH